MNYFLLVWKKAFDFSGRAARREYWWFTLFSAIASILLTVFDAFTGMYSVETGYGVLSTIYMLAAFIPSLAVMVRRLHDTNKSGWWLLLLFIPLIGAIVILVFFVTGSDEGENRFGPMPVYVHEEDPVQAV